MYGKPSDSLNGISDAMFHDGIIACQRVRREEMAVIDVDRRVFNRHVARV